MSDSDRASDLSGSKRAASPTNAVAETPAQRLRLSSSITAAADSSSAVRPPLSAAQRCADDALIIIFGFMELGELLCAARACRAWLAAAAKERPRGRTFRQADRLADLCASPSPFRRHISRLHLDPTTPISLERLAKLRHLAELKALSVQLDGPALSRLLNEEGGEALAELKAAFPPNLRQLALFVSKRHSTAACQLLLDALPAMEGLQKLSLTTADNGQCESLSLEPLLQLPNLINLEWDIGRLTVLQLLTIKHFPALQQFKPSRTEWTAEKLAAFCRPLHRLQRLEEVEMSETLVDAATMTELARLPALTAIESSWLWPDAYAFLPRLPRLQRLRATIKSQSAVAEQENKALVRALSQCPTITELTLRYGDCTESFGDQLVQAVPQLRSLHFQWCSLPSLRFLRHAPYLQSLSLYRCQDVRPGHVFGLGSFAPQLQSLRVEYCAGLDLDKAERQLLTPPGALGMPHLREFLYHGRT